MQLFVVISKLTSGNILLIWKNMYKRQPEILRLLAPLAYAETYIYTPLIRSASNFYCGCGITMVS